MLTFDSILIVDDDPIALYLAEKQILEVCHFRHLYKMKNADAAFAFIQQEYQKGNVCPELILLDINMPGMDADEFLQILYEYKCDIKTKIIAVTNSYLRKESSPLAYSISYTIEKPITKESLEFALKTVFTHKDVSSHG